MDVTHPKGWWVQLPVAEGSAINANIEKFTMHWKKESHKNGTLTLNLSCHILSISSEYALASCGGLLLKDSRIETIKMLSGKQLGDAVDVTIQGPAKRRRSRV